MLDVFLTPSRLQFLSDRVGAQLNPDQLVQELNTYSSRCIADPEPKGGYRLHLNSPTLEWADENFATAGAMIVGRYGSSDEYFAKFYLPGFDKPVRWNSQYVDIRWNYLSENI